MGKAYGLKNQVFVHCYMDGRDTDPRSGKGFIEQVTKVCAENDAAIASIVGRFYAMDRDKRWERVKEGYDLIVNGTGKQATDMVQAMQESYDEGVTDEFIKPIHNAIAKAVWVVDNCVREVIEAAKANDYEAIIIADHGNADNAINHDGTRRRPSPASSRCVP